MRTFPLDIVGNINRTRFLTPLLFIIGLAIAYLTAGYIVSGDFTSLAFVAMIAVGAVAASAILGNWGNGTYFFLAWLLFEDFARKSRARQPFARLFFRFFWSLSGLAQCRCSTPPPPAFFTVSSA